MHEHKVGYVSNFFGKISVAAINVTEGIIKEGDTIHIQGATTDFEQPVASMQMEHLPVKSAKAGESIGLKVLHAVRKNDDVFKVIED